MRIEYAGKESSALKKNIASLSVILPAHNEEEAIAHTVHEVIDMLSARMQDFEVIVVDDGSRDRTGVILDTIARVQPRLRVIHHSVNQGYGAALVSGFEAGSKDPRFLMVSDGAFHPHRPRGGGKATGAKPAVILRAFRELFYYAIKWHREEKREERAKERQERNKQPSAEPVGAREAGEK